MDISRAVDEFVSSGILLFHHLQAEGQSLSRLELHTLAAELQVLQSETTRLRDQQSRSPRAPAWAPILRMFDPHSMDLYWDKALLLETVIAFIRVGLEMQDTVVGPCNENVPGSYCRRVTARGFEKEDLLFL
jgi:hypothetical protein